MQELKGPDTGRCVHHKKPSCLGFIPSCLSSGLVISGLWPLAVSHNLMLPQTRRIGLHTKCRWSEPGPSWQFPTIPVPALFAAVHCGKVDQGTLFIAGFLSRKTGRLFVIFCNATLDFSFNWDLKWRHGKSSPPGLEPVNR